MPPVDKPLPRFLADAPVEGFPYGRWAEQLAGEFMRACRAIPDRPTGTGDPGDPVWFPERSWGGRTYVPVIAMEASPSESDRPPLEYFGHVSFERLESGHPHGIRAVADFTDVTAEQNPDWEIDLNDDEIGVWRGEGERKGNVTLVWGRPLVPGAVTATAELDGDVSDQATLAEDRFTLIAVDALIDGPDEHFLTLRLWNGRGEQLAEDGLYADDEE